MITLMDECWDAVVQKGLLEGRQGKTDLICMCPRKKSAEKKKNCRPPQRAIRLRCATANKSALIENISPPL